MPRPFKEFSIAQNIIISTILIVVISLATITIGQSLTFSNSTFSVVESTSKEINKQVILNYENYIDSVMETANYIQVKTTEYGLDYDTNKLNEVYEPAAEIQTDIESIILIDISGNLVASSTKKDLSTDDLTLKNWYLNAIDERSIFHFSSPHIQDVIGDSQTEVITITKVIDYYVGGVKQPGILIIDLNTTNLIELSNTTNLGEKGHIVILNADDSLVYSNRDSCMTTDCESVVLTKEIIIGGKLVTVEETDMYANVNILNNTRWRIATFINVDIIRSSRNQTLVLAGIIFTLTLTATIIASTYLSRRISSPITKLQNHMELIQKGNLYKKIEVTGQKEVVVLGDSFNVMIEEIRGLMETILVEQKEKRKTEFIALQTQINPHFLYNTLDSIVYLSENGFNDKVQEMVVALSKFFRISISRGKNIITLEEELEHARNYLLIQQIRYNEKFKFEFEIEDQVNKYRCVKLILQPIIENAIAHGINTEYDNGKIVIRAYEKDEKLVLEVEDDGYGIPEEKIKEMYENMKVDGKQKSIGLRNVYQRLKLYYGDETEFIIDSELDESTIIRVLIPIERAK